MEDQSGERSQQYWGHDSIEVIDIAVFAVGNSVGFDETSSSRLSH